MAMTKAEAAKLTNDLLLRGVVETIVKESSVLQLLPFMEVTGVNSAQPTTKSTVPPTFSSIEPGVALILLVAGWHIPKCRT